MKTFPKTLLVIFAEGALEKQIVEAARRLGAHGYTAWDVRGASGLDQAQSTHRDGAWDADREIEIKIVADRAVAEAIAEYVLKEFAPDYAVSLYFTQVEVVREQKF